MSWFSSWWAGAVLTVAGGVGWLDIDRCSGERKKLKTWGVVLLLKERQKTPNR
jgi:hypothetical protein